jgi:hypothetical protein
VEAVMPDRRLTRDTRNIRRRFADTTIVMGIVFICVLLALILFGGGMINEGEKSVDVNTMQPDIPAPGLDPYSG